MIGVMLLVGVTVLAVAIVAVVLLSGPQPDEIPRATIIAGNKSGSLVLAHEGGDPLREGEYRIYVDTGSGLMDGTRNFTEPEGGVWSIGGNITYKNKETLKRVVVTTVSGGSETILAEPGFAGGGEETRFSPDPVEPGVTTVGPETPGSGSDGDASPIQIVSPDEGQNLIFFSNSTTTMKADVTSLDVDRVDFILYPFDRSRTNHKEVLMRAVPGESGSYVWSGISTSGDSGLAKLQNGDKVVMIAVAYKGEQVIGVVARVATVSK